MTEKLEIYKCNICGNVVQVLLSGVGELVCCGESMSKLSPNTVENNELAEKHTPEIEFMNDETFVKLTKHPMSPEHYIQFIQVQAKDASCVHTKFLNPNETAEFNVSFMNKDFDAYELCNIHGLWRNTND